MDQVCARCARLSLSKKAIPSPQARSALRSFSTSQTTLADDESGKRGVGAAGMLFDQAMRRSTTRPGTQPQTSNAARSTQPAQSAAPRRPVLRRTAPAPAPSQGSFTIRRTAAPERGQTQGSSAQAGQALRRAPPQGAQVLRRVPPQGGSFLKMSRVPGAGGGPVRTGGRPGMQRGGQRPDTQRGGQRPGQRGPDRRRRAIRKEEDDDIDNEAVERDMNAYVAKYIDQPANPTETIAYNPSNMTIDDLKADWPNTPMTPAGMTESVVQKIEWLARRLPHGYQSPEQIAEHYLKGNLTRFESEEEKQAVLKLAAEKSAQTKADDEAGVLNKHRLPTFAIVEDSAFTSLSTKDGEKSFLVDTAVKGDYGEPSQQKFPFMQSAARVLMNNETYGPVQARKLLDRVQALIPQGRSQVAQKAEKA